VAITIPGDWTHLSKPEISGYVPAAIEPVNTLAQRTHFMYRNHTPAAFTGVVWSTMAATQETFFPISPSADGLDYTALVNISYAGNDTFTLRAYYTAGTATNGATWTQFGTQSTALTGSPTHSTLTATGGIPAAAKFIRIVTSTGATTNHQVTGVTVYPAPGTPAATQDSGFIAFDNGFLGTGAPIHTEYLNRCANNAIAVYKDRKWCVWSFLQTAALPLRISCATPGAYRSLGMAACSMPDDLLTRTATVKVRANDSSGTDGYVEVYQLNGQTTGSTLTADNTDRSTTITLTGANPVIGARIVANGTMDVYYVKVEVSPSLEKQGTSKDLITSAAPPARTEYLTTLDGLQARLYWQPYPVTGVVMDPSYYVAGHVLLSMRVGPGVRRFRCALTRYILGGDATSVVALATFKNSDSGTATHESITIQSDITGSSESHPLTGSTDEEKTANGAIEYGSLVDMPTVNASTFPTGLNRLAEIVESDTAQTEVFFGFANVYGFGGEFLTTTDVTTL